MSQKYHIGLDGVPRVCTAKYNCRLGSKDEHFGSSEEAQIYADVKSKIESGVSLDSQIQNIQSQLEDIPEHDELRTKLAFYSKFKNTQMTEEKEFQEVVKNVSEPDGGGTWNPFSFKTPIKGFCYSPYPERSQVVEINNHDMGYGSEEDMETIVEYIKKNEDLLKKENHYLGLWNSPHDGKIYLDVSVVSMDASVARKESEEKDQQAFFDLQTFDSVTVDPNATSGQKE